MKKILLLFIFLLNISVGIAQINWLKPQKQSSQILAYKISAITAEKYIKQDSIPVNDFLNIMPIAKLNNSYLIDSLPVGHYVFLRIINNTIDAEIKVNTKLVVYPLINQQLHLFEVRNQAGNFIEADVWVNDKQAKFIAKGLYEMKQTKLKEKPFIKVCTPGDTVFVSFEKEETDIPLSKQRWKNFKSTNLGQVVFWLPNQIKLLFKKKPTYKSNATNKGYIVFNQPKYKLTDTVKFKAYILNSKEKQYTQPLQVYLNYYNKNKYYKQLLATLKPVTDGAFVYQFALSDTLFNDITYTISFYDGVKERNVFKGIFKTEDYVLDEVATYTISANKDVYYTEDSLVFTASAKDANDLPLLDGRVRLIITANNVNDYKRDSLYVADTLYNLLKPLETKGDTKFILPKGYLPKAVYSIKATAIFTNSNNEIQERTVDVSINETSKEIRAYIQDDTVYANFYENGILQQAIGEVDIDAENNAEQTTKVSYPFRIKIDPLASDYNFTVLEGATEVCNSRISVSGYTIGFSRKNVQDTVGFSLYNSHKIKVNYIILDGTKVIDISSSTEPIINWQKKVANKRKLFTLKYSYVWGGKQKEKVEQIGLLYKLVQIGVKSKQEVYPGEKDSIEITVKDYKGNAVPNFNLTAASYNSQFKKDIAIKEPPYLAKYKQKPLLLKDYYNPREEENIYVTKAYPLYNNKAWINKFGVDSLWYYQMLYPTNKLQIFSTQINSFYPQLAVYVVDGGKPMPIYILYVDRKPVYYSVTNVKQPYSFNVYARHTQIGLRLYNKYIEIDSVYLQPYYKHNVVIDIANLPDKVRVFDVNDYYNYTEVSIIENSTFQLSSSYQDFYLWQNSRVASGINTNTRASHFMGPFNVYDSLHFFQPSVMDIHFKFEPGYEYSFSNNILRLEKKSILQTSINVKKSDKPQYYLKPIQDYVWPNNFGDTITEPPIIDYPITPSSTHMYTANGKKRYDFYDKKQLGKLIIQLPKDSIIYYVAFTNIQDTQTIVFHHESLFRLPVGLYNMYVITNKHHVAQKIIEVKPFTTLYCKATHLKFAKDPKLIDSLSNIMKPLPYYPVNLGEEATKTKIDTIVYEFAPTGNNILRGIVKDAQGNMPVPHASVVIKNTKKGISTNEKGEFVLQNLADGVYTLLVSSVGYATKEIKLHTTANMNLPLEVIAIEPSYNFLDDVVVVGYGTVRKKSVTGSISKISTSEFSVEQTLQGRVAGLQVQQNWASPGADARIMIRGNSSISDANKPLLVINGILYNEIPAGMRLEDMESIEVLKDASATALYGARAANGVIIMNAKKGSILRTQFRDYAFWHPNFFTDAKGVAKIEVTYPDNITSWETYILGMDKKKRMGKTIAYTKAYKPVMAQLSLPQFLIEEDEVELVGKVVNYTKDTYAYNAKFSVVNFTNKNIDATVQPAASNIEKLKVVAPLSDTLKASFTLQTTTHFKDGEERKIPIFKKGVQETIGSFWLMNNDSVISFSKQPDAGVVEVNAVANTIDILLAEIEHLKKYPFYCMEQTASKLKGLLFEKQIKEQLHQPTDNDKEIEYLKSKLQKAQNFDGSWGWWEGGKANIHITNYIINTLLLVQKDELIKTNVRNGLLYLQNQLPQLNKDELLATLFTMNQANHAFIYTDYFNQLKFDSLTLYQQWQYVKIKQQQNVSYAKEIDTLFKQANTGMLGSLSWGAENYRWYNNITATTLIAFDVCKNDEKYKTYIPKIIQYFLQQRKNGYWTNTVESANILAALLPEALASNKSFSEKPTLKISGDTLCDISSFPFNKTMSSNIRQLQFSKTGGGYLYLTAFQHKWNRIPQAVEDKFIAKTSFEKNGQTQTFLQTGERVKMLINLEVVKDAEYVMIEVPIPAGCVISAKTNAYNIHKEYFKNKVLMFTEFLAKGTYTYEIDLEPRYTGKFTLNAAKAELMYFPIFYGRNENKFIEIKD